MGKFKHHAINFEISATPNEVLRSVVASYTAGLDCMRLELGVMEEVVNITKDCLVSYHLPSWIQWPF